MTFVKNCTYLLRIFCTLHKHVQMYLFITFHRKQCTYFQRPYFTYVSERDKEPYLFQMFFLGGEIYRNYVLTSQSICLLLFIIKTRLGCYPPVHPSSAMFFFVQCCSCAYCISAMCYRELYFSVFCKVCVFNVQYFKQCVMFGINLCLFIE